jgi:hypothetical protein
VRRRPFLFLIDLEPDGRTRLDPRNGWHGLGDALALLGPLRRNLEAATGTRVQFNWFLRCDPQIAKTFGRPDWVADACPQIVEAIASSGDYAGIHVHLWCWDERRNAWYNELNNPSWTKTCLEMSIEAYARTFSRAPEACRFGDRWLNQDAVEQMRASGIRYDLTVEPGLPDTSIPDDPLATGALPDYRRAPRQPYVPSRENYLSPATLAGPDDLWEIPLTTTRPMWRMVHKAPWLMKASFAANLALGSSTIWPLIRNQLDNDSAAPISTVFRSGDLATPKLRRNFLANTRELARHPTLARCVFTNPAEAIAYWTAAAP